jgi:hypothetical protein
MRALKPETACCLLAGLLCAFASPAVANAPPGRYTFPAAGTVYDTRTNLTWQQADDTNSYTQSAATTYCANLSLAGTGWRLPTVAELESIVDDTRSNPAIDPTAFPGAQIASFWSSTPIAGASGHAWMIMFDYGVAQGPTTSSTYRVRCVR